MFYVPLKLKVLAPLMGGLIVVFTSLQGPTTAESVVPPNPGTESLQEAPPKPGAEHKWLSGRVGTWKVTSKWKMTPEAEWMETGGTETCSMVCGGFWQLTVQKGAIMGMQFEGRMQLGYDQHKKKFVGTWIDSFSSYQAVMEGTLSDDKKILTMHFEIRDMAGKPVKARTETTIESKDKATFKMFMPGKDGKDFMSMQQTITRTK